MSPWLFNAYMEGVVREVNVRVLGKGLELLSANGGRFEINQLLFADDVAHATWHTFSSLVFSYLH